jgi:hypothetical protein
VEPQESEVIRVQLTQGQVSVIDDKYADLAKHNWTANWCEGTRSYYATRTVSLHGDSRETRKRKRQELHRAIMEMVVGRPLSRAEQVDHINHDSLDNREANLRLATPAQNQHNARLRSDSVTGLRGVSWEARRKKWEVYVRVEKKRHYVGAFDDMLQAVVAHDLKCIEAHGEFAQPNYPRAAYGFGEWT